MGKLLMKPVDLDVLVNRFLAWKLPGEVCSDPCASIPFYKDRTGTNLLTAAQARQMIEHILDLGPEGIDSEGGSCD